MLDHPLVNLFAHIKPGDTEWKGDGLRDFFLYKDLGVAEATGGRVLAQLVKAARPPEHGTGWHQHVAEFHIVLMLKGWARFMYRGQGAPGRHRRLRAPAPGDHPLPVRLLARHGIPGSRRPGGFRDRRRRLSCPGAAAHALAGGVRRTTGRGATRRGGVQNSTSSSSICSGSASAAAVHSQQVGPGQDAGGVAAAGTRQCHVVGNEPGHHRRVHRVGHGQAPAEQVRPAPGLPGTRARSPGCARCPPAPRTRP